MEVRLLGKQSVYLEISDEFKRCIRMGVIKTGEKLPSCRVFGVQLGINPATVERAYSVLEADGYVVMLPKKGAFVCYVANASDELNFEAEKQIGILKLAGLTHSELTEIVAKVYKEEKEIDRN